MNKSKLTVSGRILRIRSGSVRGWVLLGVVIVAGVIGQGLRSPDSWLRSRFSSDESDGSSQFILHTAEVGPFRITITENGTVDSLQNSTLVNSVEGTTTIISLVPEGSRVNAPVVSEIDGVVELLETESQSEGALLVRAEDGETRTYEFPIGPFTEILVGDRDEVRAGDYVAGDVLCELDSSSLVEEEKQQQINVTTAQADLEKAAKNIEIQETTNESVLAQAQLAETLAKLDLEKYTAEGGEYDQTKQTLEGDIKQLEEELAMAQEDYEKVRDQARRGYTNLNNLEAARIKVTQQKILLDVKTSELSLLERFTKIRTESELKQTAEDSKRETRRAELEGQAAMAGLKADYDARRLTLQVEEEKLARLLRQIKACRLVAPQQGEVVYASQQSRRSEPVVIEEGATVRERQAIINLPDLDQMKIDARIHESRISRVSIGQPVEISVDAVTSVTYHGVLESVSSVPVPGNWPNTDLKEYEAAIRITDKKELVRQLKPGMTAEIRIIVDNREEKVLQVPVQCVMALADRFYAYVVVKGKPQRRELKVGDANDEYMEILDGIAEGERVIMNPRTHFSREINELELQLIEEESGEAGADRTDSEDGPSLNRPQGERVPAQRPPADGSQPSPNGGRPDPQAMMKRLDKNQDGAITKDEGDMRGNFDKFDADSDGRVTLEELRNGMSGSQQ